MILLKILFWVIVVVLAILILVGLAIVLALSVKIQIGFDYDPDGVRLKLKYGIIPLKIYPELFAPEKKEKLQKIFAKLKYWFGPTANKVKNIVQDKAEIAKEKNEVKSELKKTKEIKEEEARIAAEEIKLNAEIAKADADVEATEAAEAAGTPFPDLIKDDEVSKLQAIKDSFATWDFGEIYDKVKGFLSGFSFDSILALFSYLGRETGKTLGKVFRKIIIKQFCVGLTVSGDDAAKTAIKYGTVSAIIFPAMGRFVATQNVKEYDIDINPDFLANKDTGELHLTVAVRPIRLIPPFIPYLLKVVARVFSFVRDYKKTKAGKAKSAKKAA